MPASKLIPAELRIRAPPSATSSFSSAHDSNKHSTKTRDMALSRSLACPNSRQWLLKSFVSTFAIPQSASPQRRNFSAPTRRRNEARERIHPAEKDAFALNAINKEANTFEDEAENSKEEPGEVPSAEEHIPWYLQSTSPLQSTAPDSLSARQRIPDLPDHPPPILAPLLQQISVDLGIDDLTLLDLRSLDPPPALGANLLMLIGTARSDKHLHVSADKLCRWLRSEHYLSPFADGLLGRQELKLKLRRKAKRSKLMSAVGGKPGSDSEDLAEGIRTGWVCVNVGVVPGAEGQEEVAREVVLERQGEFLGFGPGGSQGTRIVVQMMTEEKRGEIHLEKLWTAVLKKSEREKEAIAKQEAVEEETEEAVADVPEPAKVETEFLAAEVVEPPPEAEEAEGPTHRRARIRGLRGRQQIRTYHTSTRRLQEHPSTGDSSPSWDAIMAQNAETSAREFYNTFSSLPALRVPRSVGLYTTFFNHIASGTFPISSWTGPVLCDDGVILTDTINELEGLPPAAEDPARETLREVRNAAEARALLGETLSAMESEDPAVDLEGEGAVDLGTAILKAIRKVDGEGWEMFFLMYQS